MIVAAAAASNSTTTMKNALDHSRRRLHLGTDPAKPIASWVAAVPPPVIIPPIHQRQPCPTFRARRIDADTELRHIAVGPPHTRANSPHRWPKGLGAWVRTTPWGATGMRTST